MRDVVKVPRVLSALLAMVTLLVMPGTVTADTEIATSGNVGAHHLKDTSSKPGVRCLYQDGAGGGDEDIYLLKVKPPVIYAANKTAARDRQLVGWRAMIQRRDPGSSFVTMHLGGTHTAWAWDDSPAVLYAREYDVTPLYGSDFRVRIQMFWYRADGSVAGTSTHEVDWYKKIYMSSDFGDDIATLHQYCPDYFPG